MTRTEPTIGPRAAHDGAPRGAGFAKLRATREDSGASSSRDPARTRNSPLHNKASAAVTYECGSSRQAIAHAGDADDDLVAVVACVLELLAHTADKVVEHIGIPLASAPKGFTKVGVRHEV